MPTVSIPPFHFIENVKRNYSCHQQALIRELIQNSVDAGASYITINLDIDNMVLVVDDDGCGMDENILVKALLTMSGSYKGPNSVGGFGAAKEIILFQHESYRVDTYKDGCDPVAVIGRQLDYEFASCNRNITGTTVTIDFHHNYGSLICLEYAINEYLSECETDAIIEFNGSIVSGRSKGELVRELEWANIYVNELPVESHYAYVRINGLMMFREWVNDTNFEVIIEVTKPSLDILTVNRDGFTYDYSNMLKKLIYEISVEKNQFGKAYGESLVWRGINHCYSDVDALFEDFLENCDSKFRESNTKAIERHIGVIANFIKNNDVSNKLALRDKIEENISDEEDIAEEIIDYMIERSDILKCDHGANFYIRVTGKGFDKIPEHLKPGNWGKRTLTLARLWKRCIKLVMKANGVDSHYSIGWIIDNDESTEAMWTQIDNINIYYMNPVLTWMRSSNHMHVFHKMLMNACHEITHMYCRYHDERFVIRYENMLHRTICMINKGKNSWWKEYLNSKKEII